MSDEAEFRRWAQERQVALLRTAVLLTGDRHRAEDLVQEALTQVALRWRRRLMLDHALARLTPRQRTVVVLRYYEDLTERATAELLGVTVGTVKSQTHLALRRLREAAPELADLLAEETR